MALVVIFLTICTTIAIDSIAKKNINKSKEINQPNIEDFNKNPNNYKHKIAIIDFSGNVNNIFMTAIADTPDLQAIGLMNLDFLPEDFAMLFIKNTPQKINMWMKNTRIPLDMIFIDENFKIIHIEKNTIPYSLDILSSNSAALGVIEINGGLADKYKIKNGYEIKFENNKTLSRQ